MTAWLWIFLPLLVAYGSALLWCVERWNAAGGPFEHCWLLPPLAAVILWSRRAEWRARPAAADRRGLWLLLPALLLHAAGALLMIDSLSATSLVLAVPGAAWLALGRPRLQGQWPVLWLVLFLVPAPIYVEGRLTFLLKELAVEAGAALGNLLGAGVARRGADLLLLQTDQKLVVADACSGLRSLLALLTLSYCLAFFLGAADWRRRASLLLAAVPLAVGANIMRIALLCLMARWFGVPFVDGHGHTIANAVEWLSALLLLLSLDRLLLWGLPLRLAGGAEPAVVPGPAIALRRVGVVLWLVAPLLLWLSVYRPSGMAQGRAERLPATIGSFQWVPRSEAQQQQFLRSLPRYVELLGTADFVWRSHRNEAGHWVYLVALYHDSNWKSVHPPRICIEGSNMDIELDDLAPVAGLPAELRASRIVARRRDDGQRFLTLSLFGTADWAAGDYAEFVAHHLPRALWRRSVTGFLLRVETPWHSGEPMAAAEARCAEFLRELLPLARQQLQ